MDITRTAVDEFWTGHGGADAVARPLVVPGYAPEKVLKGVRVRAATANGVVIYVGPTNVTEASGYPLPAGEEVEVQIEDISRINVVATPAGNTEQVVTLGGTGETYELVLDGEATDPIATDAAAGAVEDALEDVVGAGNVSVSGNAGGPYTVEFTGDLAKTDVPLLIGLGEGVNEKQTIVVSDALGDEALILTYDGQSTTAPLGIDATSAEILAALKGLNNIGDDDVAVTDMTPAAWEVEFIGDLAKTDVSLITGVCTQNEKQTIVVTLAEVNDKLVLTYDGQSTAELDYDATSAEVATALKALNNIGDNDVAVTDGDPAGWVVEFKGALAATDVDLITGVCGKNEKQTIVVTLAEAGDKLVLTYDGQSTAELAYNATSAQVATALKALSNIGDSDVSVTDGDPAGWVVEFTGALAKTDVPEITGVCGKNEKQTIVVTLAEAGDKLVLTYDGQSTAELAYNATSAQVATALKALSNIGDSDVSVTDGDPAGWVVEFTGALAKTDVPEITGVCGKNEKQTIGLDDGVSDGTFTLTFNGQTTGAIAYNATAATVEDALELLSTIGEGNVSVTGGPGPGTDWVAEFINDLAMQDVVAMTGDGTNLVGAVKTVTITETVSGNEATVDVDETVSGNEATVDVDETVSGNEATVDVDETVSGNEATVDVDETVSGNEATVDVEETVKGNEATVTVTEIIKGDDDVTIAVTKTDASAGSQFSWIAV